MTAMGRIEHAPAQQPGAAPAPPMAVADWRVC